MDHTIFTGQKVWCPLCLLRPLLSALHLNEGKPKCNCYFPNIGKYGVLGRNEHCEVIDCEPPKPKSTPRP